MMYSTDFEINVGKMWYDCDSLLSKNNNPEPKKVVFNNPATIVFWEDGTKTVVKTMDKDEFDPERGYLQAFYEKSMNDSMSRTKCNKYLMSLREQYEKQISKE